LNFKVFIIKKSLTFIFIFRLLVGLLLFLIERKIKNLRTRQYLIIKYGSLIRVVVVVVVFVVVVVVGHNLRDLAIFVKFDFLQ
jgi:hypothetical protein